MFPAKAKVNSSPPLSPPPPQKKRKIHIYMSGRGLGISQLQVQRPKHSVVICLVVLFAVSAFFKAETRLFFLR